MPCRLLPRVFYERDTIRVAKELLGKRLVRVLPTRTMSGMIVEVEAYRGRDDPASHAYRGMTARNAAMFGEAGRAYIYFTYGNHYCLNATTERAGVPGAVLIRALEPLEGLNYMRKLRPRRRDQELSNGPGKLTKAFAIGRGLNGCDMTKAGPLFVTRFRSRGFKTSVSPRVGIRRGSRRKWRFYISGNQYVSKRNPYKDSL